MEDEDKTKVELIKKLKTLRKEQEKSELNNITERKQREQALIKSEEKYQTIFENTGTATVILEENTVISMANTQFEKLSGYSKDEIENKMKWTDFVISEDLERMKKYHIARRKAGKNPPTEYEFRLIDKKGNIKNIFLKAAMIPNTKKSITSLMDITERKQAEEKYRKLIKTTSKGFWFLNSKKLTVEVNQSLCDMLGYARNEMIGKTPMEFVDAENKKIFKEQTSEIENTTHRNYEISLKKKNGINVPTIINATTLVDKKGETEGSFAFVTDITERKKAEEKLKTITERLELAMDAGEHGFWDWNLDTDDIYFSPRYYTMLGYKPGELPMRKETWAGLMHPEDQKIIVPKVEKHVKNAESYEVEFRLKTKDGDWKWISGRGKSYSIDKKGISHRAIGVHVDITERKQSEERLKKTMGTTIQTMSKIIEVKDPYTAGHQQRVSQLTTAIAKELNLPPDKIEGIKITSLLHDIGKISVPTEILSKTTTLSDIEFSLIKEHSQAGHDILKAIDFSYPVANIVLQHHERLNGSGYPQGLKGDEILLEARILGVADVVEAMSSHRPYRPSLGIDAALEEISKNKGILYDPEVVDACLKLFKEKGFKLE